MILPTCWLIHCMLPAWCGSQNMLSATSLGIRGACCDIIELDGLALDGVL